MPVDEAVTVKDVDVESEVLLELEVLEALLESELEVSEEVVSEEVVAELVDVPDDEVKVEVDVLELAEVEAEDEVEADVEVLVDVVEVVLLLALVVVTGAGTIPNAVPKYTSEADKVAATFRLLPGAESCSHSAHTVGVPE